MVSDVLLLSYLDKIRLILTGEAGQAFLCVITALLAHQDEDPQLNGPSDTNRIRQTNKKLSHHVCST